MFRLGVIEESLINKQILNDLNRHFISQRLQEVPDDEFSIWHINEYHVDDSEIEKLLDILKEQIDMTWYCHAFNEKKMFVVLRGKWFEVSIKRDNTWNDMIHYGTAVAGVERFYLENIPLQI